MGKDQEIASIRSEIATLRKRGEDLRAAILACLKRPDSPNVMLDEIERLLNIGDSALRGNDGEVGK
jgi:hypothetical protein